MEAAPPELRKLASEWLAKGHERDIAWIAAHSYTPSETAIHTVAGVPDGHLPLSEFIAHLDGAPPREVVASDPSGFVHGDVAWLVDLCAVDMLHEGILHERFTTVMARVDGEWKVVHAHLSQGVPHDLTPRD